MKQPKFTFGDEVITRLGHIFTVGRIKQGSTDEEGLRYLYTERDGHTLDWQYENEIELYHRPQKKKLYAYESEGFIAFKRHDQDVHPSDREKTGVDAINWTHVLKRVPDYDIEYPEGK